MRCYVALLMLAVLVFPIRAASAQTAAASAATDFLRGIDVAALVAGDDASRGRFQSLITQVTSASGPAASTHHLDESEIETLGRKEVALDLFVPDPAASQMAASDLAERYSQDPSKRSVYEAAFAKLIDRWHAYMARHHFASTMSESYFLMYQVAFKLSDPTGAAANLPMDTTTIDGLTGGLSAMVGAQQLANGHVLTNADKQRTYDTIGAAGETLMILSDLSDRQHDSALASSVQSQAARVMSKVYGSASTPAALIAHLRATAGRAVFVKYRELEALP